MRNCIFAVLLLVSGVSSGELVADYASPLVHARYRAHAMHGVWAATRETPAVVPDTPDVAKNCKCHGTKKSGDGIGPCVCGPSCKCTGSSPIKALPLPVLIPLELPIFTQPPYVPPVEEVAALPAKQLLYATQKSCGLCKPIEKNTLPALKKAGWDISEAETAQIRIIHVDLPEHAETCKQFNIEGTPAFILIVRDPKTGVYVEKGRRMLDFPGDVIDVWDVGKLYHGKDQRPKKAAPKKVQFQSYGTNEHWSRPVDVLAHLLDPTQHGTQQHGYNREQLERMQRINPTFLEDLHTDLHRGAANPQPTTVTQVAPATAPVYQTYQTYQTYRRPTYRNSRQYSGCQNCVRN